MMEYKFCSAAVRGMEQIVSQKAGGSYVLSGERGLGKNLAAQKAAAQILGKEVATLTSSPDYFYVCAEDGVIKTESLEALKRFTSFLPSENCVKVCIIDDANTMTETAQNSLLKTLEEESVINMFLLVAHEELLPTIQSRSFEVAFSPISDDEMRGLYPDVSDITITLADGHPGRVAMLSDGKFGKDMENILSCFREMENKRELFEVYHLLKEKDKYSFFEQYDKSLVRASLKVVSTLFLNALTGEDSPYTEHICSMYEEEDILLVLSYLQDAMHSMKKKGQFSRSDFFDLIRVMVA